MTAETISNQTTVKSTVKEKIAFAISGVGGGAFCWGFISGFIMLYYTDSVGMSAATMGTMMLIARVLDGITDVLVGALIEKTHNKLGKGRPWYILSAPLLAICLFLCFNVPASLSTSGKVAYISATYILMCAGAYTIYGMSEQTVMARMSTDPKDISTIATVKMSAALFMATVVYILANGMVTAFGGTKVQAAWTKVAALYAILALVMVLIGSINVKEKIADRIENKDVPKIPMKVAMGAAFKHPESLLLLFVFIVNYIASGIMSSSTMYYLGYVIGDFSKIAISSTLSVFCQFVPIMFVPLLLKKFDKIKLMRFCFISSGALSLIRLAAPTSFTLFVVGACLQAAFLAPTYAIIWTLSVDLIMYVAAKSGIRVEGFINAIGSIGVKVGTGIGTAMVGWLLSWGQYNGAAYVQPESAVKAIIIMSIVLPGILYIVDGLLMCMWHLQGKLRDCGII